MRMERAFIQQDKPIAALDALRTWLAA